VSALDVTAAVFYTLVFPGLLFTGVVGLLLTWVDRKVTAIVQSRVGPPWYQPFADVGKLLAKRMVIPRGAPALGFLAAPLLAITGATLSAAIVFQAVFKPEEGFIGDLIVLVYLTALPAIGLIVGGASSRSPFGAVGASREMSLILAYEAGFLLALSTVVVHAGSIRLADVNLAQLLEGPIVWSPSGLLAMAVLLVCVQAKLGFLPFDISEAETEIIGGPLAEYSGVGLGLFKLSRAMMFLVLPALVVVLFWGPVTATPASLVAFLAKLLVVEVLLIVAKVTHARVRLDQALRFFWGKVVVVGLLAAALAVIGL